MHCASVAKRLASIQLCQRSNIGMRSLACEVTFVVHKTKRTRRWRRTPGSSLDRGIALDRALLDAHLASVADRGKVPLIATFE
jgi:hypothetical protein